jgi:hypothetical protein
MLLGGSLEQQSQFRQTYERIKAQHYLRVGMFGGHQHAVGLAFNTRGSLFGKAPGALRQISDATWQIHANIDFL